MATQKNTAVKCRLCEKKLVSKQALIDHIERVHGASIPEGWSPARYENFIRTGKTEGRCVECHKPTTWNETTGKYNRMCGSEACKKKARERASRNYIGLHGKPYSINNPEQQAKMIYGRKNSGTYIFEKKDGKKYMAKYDSSYGRGFLEMIDTFLGWDGQDVFAPSPHIYWYMYEGKKHFYMPDVYLASINCEVELKDGGDNPNKHPKIQAVDKVKEAAKDKVMESLKGQVNYIKICNKDYSEFFAMLSRLKAQDECPLPKWESKLEPALESSGHMDVCRPTDDNNLSTRFTAYHLDEKMHKGSPWDEELYSKTLEREICNLLSSIALHVQKGKTTQYVYTLGKDYKAILLGAITIYWYDYWDHTDPQYDFEWDYREEIDIADVDERYIVREAVDPLRATANLLKRDQLLKDPMLDYDSLLLYYRNKLFHSRLNKHQWVMLYSELENIRDYLKVVINSKNENDDRMKYEARKALKEVNGFFAYMDNSKPTLEAFSIDSENMTIWRVTYDGVGVYEAYRASVNDADWLAFKKTSAATWLPVPPKYRCNHRSYFTDDGFGMFNQLTLPELLKVLDGSKISVRSFSIPKNTRFIYRDKYQVVLFARPALESVDMFSSGDFDDYACYANLDSAREDVTEGVVSHVNPNHIAGERFSLSTFKSVPISKQSLDRYKKQYPFLRHIREDDGGVIWIDGDKVVGVMGAAPHKETLDQSQIWIHSFEISKEYQNHGLSRQMLDYGINKLHARYLSVNKNNEVAFSLYKKVGFEVYGENKTMYFLKLRGSATPKFTPITESTIITRDDIRHNVDKWKPGVGTNVLLITGLSGSGKTTTGYEIAYEHKAELFQLDWLDHPEQMQDSPETPNYGLWQYIKKVHGRNMGYAKQKTGDQWHNLVIDVFDSICRFAKKSPDKLFIIEGVQIPGHLHDVLGIEKYPIIIKGTSVTASMIQRFKRDGLGNALQTGGVNILKYYMDAEKYMNMFRNQIISTEVFDNMVSEHPMLESSSAAMITYGTNASDVEKIVDTMTDKEREYIGHPKNEKFFWENRVFYNQILYVNKEPAAFIKVYTTYTDKETGHIVLGTAKKFRGNGYAKMLTKKFSQSKKPVQIKYVEYGYDNGNRKSAKLAKSLGFEDMHRTDDRKGYTSERSIKDFKKQMVTTEATIGRRNISFGKSQSDILSIISSMTQTEQLYLGSPGNRYIWEKCEFYQEVLYIDSIPAAFLVVAETPADKGVGHIVIGVRSGTRYRHQGYATALINRFLTSGQIPNHITELEWGFDDGNSKSERLAAKFGFKDPVVSPDQLHHRGYTMTRGVKEILPVIDAKSEVIRQSLIREENWYNSLEATYIEASKDQGRYLPVFVFLSYTGTNMAKLIKAFTHDPYAHSSLSFDTNLENMVSFNRDGMVGENIITGVYKKNAANIRYSLYMYMATAAEYDAMRNFVDELLGKRNKLKYNVLGLTNFIFGRGSSREDRYFCSEFIAATISAGNSKLFDKQPYMVSPYYFAKNKNFIFIKTGILKNYDRKVVDKLIAEKLEEGGFSDVIIK